MDLNDLLNKYEDKNSIPYIELLKTEEWKNKRAEILKRDGYKCLNCNKSETFEILDSNKNIYKHYWLGEDVTINISPNEKDKVPSFILAEKPYHLEVHHKIYVDQRLPWEYEDNELITFCNWCHWEYHQNNIIIAYTEDMLNELKYTPCKRCSGAGWFPEYRKIEGGICFRCRGKKFEELIRPPK